ncbi:MAG: sortase [Streptosporangiales bacterium]|nr:sortase [Streptosporangiales bacterium]
MSRKRRGGTRRARHSTNPSAPAKKLLHGRVLLVLAVVAVVVGTTVVGLANQGRQLVRPLDADEGEATPSASAPKIHGPVMKKSLPLAIRIKAIRLESTLVSLGLQRDGTVEPPPAKHADHAGWYESSPTPGEAGPSVILGYQQRVAGMPAPVFRHLGKVRKQDRIEVRRADKTVAVFAVDRAERYTAERFPTDEVYGAVDHAGLRLITATAPGRTPAASERNVVVYASLVKSRKAA